VSLPIFQPLESIVLPAVNNAIDNYYKSYMPAKNYQQSVYRLPNVLSHDLLGISLISTLHHKHGIYRLSFERLFLVHLNLDCNELFLFI